MLSAVLQFPPRVCVYVYIYIYIYILFEQWNNLSAATIIVFLMIENKYKKIQFFITLQASFISVVPPTHACI